MWLVMRTCPGIRQVYLWYLSRRCEVKQEGVDVRKISGEDVGWPPSPPFSTFANIFLGSVRINPQSSRSWPQNPTAYSQATYSAKRTGGREGVPDRGEPQRRSLNLRKVFGALFPYIKTVPPLPIGREQPQSTTNAIIHITAPILSSLTTRPNIPLSSPRPGYTPLSRTTYPSTYPHPYLAVFDPCLSHQKKRPYIAGRGSASSSMPFFCTSRYTIAIHAQIKGYEFRFQAASCGGSASEQHIHVSIPYTQRLRLGRDARD